MERFRFCIRPVAVFAGIIGMLQSALWIALCITGITAYYCHIDLDERPNALGSLMELTFFKVYFSGPCEQQISQSVDFSALDDLNVIQPSAVHGVIWAYLMLSFFWFISSVTMVTSVKFQYIRYANIFLFVWISLTSVISILDLSFGILFGLDYGTFMTAVYHIELTAPIIQSADAVLIAAQASAGVMMGVAFRGFLLWLLNVVLICYFFTQTLLITDYNRANQAASGADNFGYRGDKNSDGYGFGNQQQNRAAPLWFNQPEGSRPASAYPTIPHVETRNRPLPPPVMTTMDRRRDDDVVMRNTNNLVREINDRNSLNTTKRNEPNPDYSPPMPRHNNPYDRQRSNMRASRF